MSIYRLFLAFLLIGCVHKPVDIRRPATKQNLPQVGRGGVVLTPLFDLRDEKILDEQKKYIGSFSDEQRLSYAEKLQYILFPNTTDNQTLTGGAIYTRVMSFENIKKLASIAVDASSLPTYEAEALKKILAPARYIAFFSFNSEKLNWNYSRQNPEDSTSGHIQKHVYSIERKMSATVSIWEADSNRFVYRKQIDPIVSSVNSVLVKTKNLGPTPTQMPSNYDKAINPDKFDLKPSISVEIERMYHANRFPPIPEREPTFSAEFKSFNPSNAMDANMTEQKPSQPKPNSSKNTGPSDNMRAELTIKATTMGVLPLPSLFLGAAILKWNILRLGGGIEFTPISTLIDHNLILYKVWNACFCLSADVEWQLGRNHRIQTGAYLGSGAFNYEPSDLMPTMDGLDPKTQGDGYLYRAPRVRYLYGDRNGAQFGFGVYQHYYMSINRTELAANHPSLWGIELTFAAAGD